MRYRCLLIAFILASLSLTTHAQSQSINEKKLSDLQNNIKNIRQQLVHAHHIRDRYQKQLKEAELGAATLREKLVQTKIQLAERKVTVSMLQSQAEHFQKVVDQNEQRLGQQIKTAYMINHAPFLELLLNQKSAKNVNRLLMYNHYIAKKQAETINTLRKSMRALAHYKKATERETRALTKLQLDQTHEEKELIKLKEIRSTVIAQLNTEIKSKSQRLTELAHNKQNLEHTLQQVWARNKQIKQEMHHSLAFYKGKLKWPTKGHVLNYFGTKIYHSELRWSGILIKASENQEIHAIANGKVVFANWLPGYGLILIINHGHGYMSLYGRDHSLKKHVGDMVKKGDIIATVGKSGGYRHPALYFAIRHNAQPLNPQKWCH